MKRHATIDIGTNTILLLIAERTSEGLLQTVVDLETATRLGEGLTNAGEISPLVMRKSVDVIHSALTFLPAHPRWVPHFSTRLRSWTTVFSTKLRKLPNYIVVENDGGVCNNKLSQDFVNQCKRDPS